MKRLALTTASLLFLGTPAFSADLDGPVYSERRVYIERQAPPVVERRIVEHHHYYYEEPREAYVAPRYYAPYRWSDAYYDGSYGYRSAYYYARPYRWHQHRHYRRW